MSAFEKPVYRLVLHPQDANYAPASAETIQTLLQDIGFIGKASINPAASSLNSGIQPQTFLVGEKFLQLLTFMGCSPNINLAPTDEADQDFCHIALSSIYTHPQFRSHERDVFARCPECGRREQHWQTALECWQADNSRTNYTCSHCAKNMSLYDLRWRQAAGFGRFFIDVFSIFPQEGIPTDKLLAALETISAQPWGYFFTNR